MQSEVAGDPLSEHSLKQEEEALQRPQKIVRTEQNHSDEGEEEEIQQIMSQSSQSQRYLVAVEYIGTRFFGSQKQANFRTVVGALEEAFQKFIGQPVPIFCSSRTDAGVHALSNVFHVDVERISKRKPGEVLPPHEPSVVRKAVNHFLQRNEGDVMVIDVRCVPSDFHARYKAQERTYHYRLLSGAEPLSSFERDRAWHVPEELDLHAMQEACKVLIGRHDFSSFRASGCQANSPVRTLDELHVSEAFSSPIFSPFVEREPKLTGDRLTAPSEKIETCRGTSISITSNGQGDSKEACLPEFGVRRGHRCFVVTARARSFLYHQVRLLVGVLKCVGTGNISVSDVAKILEAKDVTTAKAMAPACGLYLGRVKYDLP